MTDLSTHPLRHEKEFTGFTDQEFHSLIEHTRFRKYGKGQILFHEEDPKQTLFYLESGLVRLERYDISGDFLYVDYVKKGRLFPYGEIFSGDMYHYTASALTNVELYALPFPLFESVLAGNTDQLLTYYKELSKILKEQERRIQFLVVSSAHTRIIHSLHYLMTELGERLEETIQIPYPITINEIAGLSGVSRETTGQTIQQLKKTGVLGYTHKRLVFKEPDYFKEH